MIILHFYHAFMKAIDLSYLFPAIKRLFYSLVFNHKTQLATVSTTN